MTVRRKLLTGVYFIKFFLFLVVLDHNNSMEAPADDNSIPNTDSNLTGNEDTQDTTNDQNDEKSEDWSESDGNRKKRKRKKKKNDSLFCW